MATTASNCRNLLLPIALILFASTVFGFLGNYFWLFDLFSHFRFQYLVLGTLFLFAHFLWARKTDVVTWLLIPVVILNLVAILPFYLANTGDSLNVSANVPVKIISINLNRLNQDINLLERYLKKSNPDFVSLFELTPEWANKIKNLKSTYPHAKAILQSDNFGIGIISKYELNNAQVFRDSIFEIPFLIVETKLGNFSFTFIAIHPFPPLGGEATASRNTYLRQVSKIAASTKGPVVMCGDMNTAPWSSIFHNVQDETGLSVPKGFGVVGTWPTTMPFTIPIDHCLTSKDLSVVNYQRGSDIGSDHYPLEIEFHPEIQRSTSSSRYPTNPK